MSKDPATRYSYRKYGQKWQIWDSWKLSAHPGDLIKTEATAKKRVKELNGQ